MNCNKNGILIVLILIIVIFIIILLFLYKGYDYIKNKYITKKILEKFNLIENDDNIYNILNIKKQETINNFDNFDNFDYVINNIKKINKESLNGFIYILEYTKPGYSKKYSILKSNIGSGDEDNLLYEYIIGLFINTKLSKFPCFIKTYGIYTYKNKDNWELFKNNNELGGDILNKSLDIIKSDDIISRGCNNKYLGIVLQYINNAKILKEKIKEEEFINKELYNVLYQIYFPLSILINVFSHNDLNYNNIMLYEINDNKYINYHYHLKIGVEITFKSKYIVKIIDYGNTYFNDGKNNTEKIYEEICKMNSCDDDCYKYSVNSEYKRHITINFLLNDIINDILNNEQIINKKNIELLQNIQDKDIETIFDNLNIKYLNNEKPNDSYLEKYNKIGDLHIFQDDRDMIYNSI